MTKDVKNKIIGILIIILAVSIYYNFNFLKTRTQEVSFEKKQECASYKKEIEDKFEKNNNSENPLEYYYFDKIFYSPLQDSCVYVYSGSFGVKATDRYKTLYLVDAFSGEFISQSTVIEAGKFTANAQMVFDQLVRSYETK